MRIELATSSLPRKCSTTELQRLVKKRTHPPLNGAGDEARTRDLQLGRLSLYQLSYSRKKINSSLIFFQGDKWGDQDSNLRTRKRTDLQSVVVGHLTISPFLKVNFQRTFWSPRMESNLRPADYKSAALPAELHGHFKTLPSIQYAMNTPFLKTERKSKQLIQFSKARKNKGGGSF
jgi:hypothetical protein